MRRPIWHRMEAGLEQCCSRCLYRERPDYALGLAVDWRGAMSGNNPAPTWRWKEVGRLIYAVYEEEIRKIS
jgi:hypothetical protein